MEKHFKSLLMAWIGQTVRANDPKIKQIIFFHLNINK